MFVVIVMWSERYFLRTINPRVENSSHVINFSVLCFFNNKTTIWVGISVGNANASSGTGSTHKGTRSRHTKLIHTHINMVKKYQDGNPYWANVTKTFAL